MDLAELFAAAAGYGRFCPIEPGLARRVGLAGAHDAGLAGQHDGLSENVASQRVLAKAGFVPVVPVVPAGLADPADRADRADIGGRAGTRYQLDLAAGSGS